MQILAETERQPGRWVLVPSKDERFLGPRERAYVRARERRRKVFTVLVEALGITALIGVFPPLRLMWLVTLGLGAVLVAYMGLLLKLKAEYEAAIRAAPRDAVPVYDEPQILENDVRFIRRRREAARAALEGSFELPATVRVYAAR